MLKIPLNWTAANRALLFCLAGLSLFWCGRAVGGILRGPGGPGSVSSLPARTDGPAGESPVRLKDLTARALFRPLVAAPPPPVVKPFTPPPAPPAPKVPLSQRAAHLSLVGVLPGPPLQAVIEDKRQGGTIYATVGKMIGEISVTSVSADRVTLSFEDETLDLTL